MWKGLQGAKFPFACRRKKNNKPLHFFSRGSVFIFSCKRYFFFFTCCCEPYVACRPIRRFYSGYFYFLTLQVISFIGVYLASPFLLKYRADFWCITIGPLPPLTILFHADSRQQLKARWSISASFDLIWRSTHLILLLFYFFLSPFRWALRSPNIFYFKISSNLIRHVFPRDFSEKFDISIFLDTF